MANKYLWTLDEVIRANVGRRHGPWIVHARGGADKESGVHVHVDAKGKVYFRAIIRDEIGFSEEKFELLQDALEWLGYSNEPQEDDGQGRTYGSKEEVT